MYTSSFRTERYIKSLFRHYGVRFDGIINGQRHEREVQAGRKERLPNKMPNRYQISLHVDDEEVIAISGRDHGFNVYQLFAQDDDWADKIIARAQEIKHKQELMAQA